MKDQARQVIPVILALAVAMAPHIPDLPLWIIVWCMLMWLYMLVRLDTGWPVPGPILRHVLVLPGSQGFWPPSGFRSGRMPLWGSWR